MSFLRHGKSIDPMLSWARLEAAVVACPQRSSASMSSSRLFLGGLVSTRAHFRFTNRGQCAVHSGCRSSILQRTANYLLTVCLTPGGRPNLCRRFLRFSGSPSTNWPLSASASPAALQPFWFGVCSVPTRDGSRQGLTPRAKPRTTSRFEGAGPPFATFYGSAETAACCTCPTSEAPAHPLVPIARTKLYCKWSPAVSGPVIAALASSGYWLLYRFFTSSGVILRSGTGSFTPLYEKLRDNTLASIMFLPLPLPPLSLFLSLRLSFLAGCSHGFRDREGYLHCKVNSKSKFSGKQPPGSSHNA
jgi:hypothetical protein